MSRLVTMGEACEVLGYTRLTLKTWIADGCPHEKIDTGKGPRAVEYKLDCGAVMRWREKRAADAIAGQMDKTDAEEAKRRKLAAEAALVELELAEARGEVLRYATILARFGETLANIRAKLLSIPSSLAPQLVHCTPDQARVLLDAAIAEALRELSGFRVDRGRGKLSEGDRGAAREESPSTP